MNQNRRGAVSWRSTIFLAAMLTACGGGTAYGEFTALDPSRNSRLPNCPASAAAENMETAVVPTIKLSLVAPARAAITRVTAQRAGIAHALLKDGRQWQPVSQYTLLGC